MALQPLLTLAIFFSPVVSYDALFAIAVPNLIIEDTWCILTLVQESLDTLISLSNPVRGERLAAIVVWQEVLSKGVAVMAAYPSIND